MMNINKKKKKTCRYINLWVNVLGVLFDLKGRMVGEEYSGKIKPSTIVTGIYLPVRLKKCT